jgi:hypothetical protein
VAKKQATVRTGFFPEPLGWWLEECLRKRGHFEDVVLKK